MGKKKLRQCPAIGGEITSAECGENRLSRYDCPESCPFNPYRLENYAEILEMEESLDKKIFQRAVADEVLSRKILRILDRYDQNDFALTPEVDWTLFRDRSDSGATFFEKWESEGFKGLRNDAQVMLRARSEARVALLEIQEILDDKRVVGLDLLEGKGAKRKVVVDRTLAARACRFESWLGVWYPLPHFGRTHGLMITMPEVPGKGGLDCLDALARHLGGSLDTDWLMQNAAKLVDSIFALKRERKRLALEKTDFVTARADYLLEEAPSAFARRLEEAGCIEDEVSEDEMDEGFQAAFLWPSPEGEDELSAAMPGSVYYGAALIRKGAVRLTSSSEKRLKALQAAFEGEAGPVVRLQELKVVNEARQAAERLASVAPVDLPESLLQGTGGYAMASSRVDDLEGPHSKEVIGAAYLTQYYEQLLDENIGALDGLTPREAAADLLVRPKLIEWMKGLLRSVDQQNLDSGSDLDLDFLARELGLDELDLPRPPRRQAPFEEDGDDEWDADWDADWDEADALDEWDDKVVPFGEDASHDARIDEIERRIRGRMDEFGTAEAALEAISASGCDLIDEGYFATEGLVSENAYNLCVMPMLMAWMAIVPKGERFVLEQGYLRKCLEEVLRKMGKVSGKLNPERAEKEIESVCDDPYLLLYLWNTLDETRALIPKKDRPDDEDFGFIMALVAASINALKRSIR